MRYIVVFLLTAGVTAVLHLLVKLISDYPSYWWNQPLGTGDNGLPKSFLFVLLPLYGAVIATVRIRRLQWFLPIAAGAILMPVLVKLGDDATGERLSRL